MQNVILRKYIAIICNRIFHAAIHVMISEYLYTDNKQLSTLLFVAPVERTDAQKDRYILEGFR